MIALQGRSDGADEKVEAQQRGVPEPSVFSRLRLHAPPDIILSRLDSSVKTSACGGFALISTK